jgi:auxin efflux carrier family
MALHEKIIVCGAGLNALGMAVALRFIAGRAATTAGAVAFGIRRDVPRFAIIHVRFYRFYL